MDELTIYKNRRRKARLAGTGYLILAFAALPDILRKRLFIPNDPVATSNNILANLSILRLSILGDIVTEISFLFLALCLYSLLKDVRRSASQAMLSMVLIAVTMTVFNTGIEIAAINLFQSTDQLHGFLLLEVFQTLSIPATFFFGLWMLPFGYVCIKSDFMSKFVGFILLIGSCGYVIHAVFQIMSPGTSEHFLFISVIAEVTTIIWLLIFGVKQPCENRKKFNTK